MSSKAPSAPPAPDPMATARAQSEFNIEGARQTANMNRVDQYTPQGSLTYRNLGAQQMDTMQAQAVQDNANNPNFDVGAWRESANKQNPGLQDRWESTTSLSPEQQGLYDQSVQGQQIYGRAALAQLAQVENQLSSPFQFSGPEMQTSVQDRSGNLSYRPDYTGIGDPNQSRDAVQEALLARINPDLERERSQLESRLANQGITMGSQAWNTGMQDYGRQANDARYGAILNAGQEQSRMFDLGMQQSGFNNSAIQQAYGMDMGRAQFGNAARGQSLQEQLMLRSQPINEASALLSGGQVQMPQFTNVPQVQVQAPDYQGAVGQQYAGQMSAWNGATARSGANNSAMAGAGSAIASAAVIAF